MGVCVRSYKGEEMKIRWKMKEDGRWNRWRDIDKTRDFLPEDAHTFEVAETLEKKDAMVFFPGMFASLRKDYKEHLKKLKKAKKNLSKKTGMKTSGELHV
jgi:hypothetical protein